VRACFVLEAMKMENELRGPPAAPYGQCACQPGQAVEKGQVLVRVRVIG
jgi:biotin carboxyl carrier protein